ncbi:hypothetical protein JAAARDRAFT_210799 [Jaapia argillacea MUCL 33604]|uniref:Uncharacterized protein n=1 Tax=Jaapia argillacea MUCL 33604 TaxID=933084 RepID=A0A067PBB5_9AGAM|nr:hypothetical protein JAAARDRAFT_210799 [Jaapia argillacea MUCL 33604]
MPSPSRSPSPTESDTRPSRGVRDLAAVFEDKTKTNRKLSRFDDCRSKVQRGVRNGRGRCGERRVDVDLTVSESEESLEDSVDPPTRSFADELASRKSTPPTIFMHTTKSKTRTLPIQPGTTTYRLPPASPNLSPSPPKSTTTFERNRWLSQPLLEEDEECESEVPLPRLSLEDALWLPHSSTTTPASSRYSSLSRSSLSTSPATPASIYDDVFLRHSPSPSPSRSSSSSNYCGDPEPCEFDVHTHEPRGLILSETMKPRYMERTIASMMKVARRVVGKRRRGEVRERKGPVWKP